MCSGWAGACAPETVPDQLDAQVVWAIETLEPGLLGSRNVPLSDRARTVASYATGHGTSDDVTEPTAAEAMQALARAYERPLPPKSGVGADAPYESAALAEWLRDASEDVSAYAVLVVEATGSRRVEHAAVYWRTPLASRIRVVRLSASDDAETTRERVLASLGTCAVAVREWISAPVDLAEDFLGREVSASMLVVANDSRSPGGEWVPPERVIDALRFEDPATEHLDAFSAWFAGERPSAWAVTRLIPTLRSSLGPRDLFELFRTAR